MKRRTSIYLLLAIFWWMPRSGKAQQNIQFSQYVFNGLSVNPAYAGYKGDWYINANYRKQWVGFPGAPVTSSISIDGLTGARDERVGVGLQFMYDKLGPEKNLSVYGSYAYRIPLNEADDKRLCIGIGVGFTQFGLDGTVFQSADGNDQAVPAANVSARTPDARFGIYYYSEKMYLGISVMDLFALYSDPTKYYWQGYEYEALRKTQHVYLTGGYIANLSEQVKLKPSIMIKEDFKGPTNMDVNVFLLFADKVWVGGSYRTGVKLWNKPNLEKGLTQLDAASIMAEFYATPQLRVGYSYDLTLNKMSGAQGGSHEISLGYLFNSKKRKLDIYSPRYF